MLPLAASSKQQLDKRLDWLVDSTATQRGEWLLALYVICLPIQFNTPLSLRFAPSDLFLAFFLLFRLSNLSLRAAAFSVWHVLLPGMFALATFLSALYNGHLTRYILLNKNLGLIVLFASYCALTSILNTSSRLRRFLRLFVWNVALHNLLAIVVYAAGWEIPGVNELGVRISGMLHDPNAFGGLLVVAFAIHTITFCQKQPLIGGAWGMFILLTLPLGILLTFSRSAWIGLAIVLLLMIGYRVVYALYFVAALLTTFIAVFLIRGGGFLEELVALASRPEQIWVRVEILQHAFRMFLDHPFFGGGLGSYVQVHGEIIHATPVWFLSEFGLLGFAVFSGFLLWFLRQGVRAYQSSPEPVKPLIYGLLMAFLGMCGLSLGIEAFYQRHWWFIMGCLAAAHGVWNGWGCQGDDGVSNMARRKRKREAMPAKSCVHHIDLPRL